MVLVENVPGALRTSSSQAKIAAPLDAQMGTLSDTTTSNMIASPAKAAPDVRITIKSHLNLFIRQKMFSIFEM